MAFFARQFEADAPEAVRERPVAGLWTDGGVSQNAISLESKNAGIEVDQLS